MQILIIEDDDRVAKFLMRGLRAEGYHVQHVTDGAEGLEAVFSHRPDLVILDRMLPTMDGISVLQQLRARRAEVKVLILSALSGTEDRIQGLRMGADDYLPKPFEFEELLARIEALHRRDRKTERTRCLELGDLRLDLDQMTFHRKQVEIALTAKEIAILELLMSNPQKVFSRERILANVWDMNEDPLTNIVDVYINRLRKKIDLGAEHSYIRTVRGVGYSIVPDAHGKITESP